MAPAADDLHRLARDFARKVQQVLNATICDGVKITAVVARPERVHVGYGLARDLLVTSPFPVRVGRHKPSCWLDVSYRLCMDEESRYLTVLSSYFGVYADEAAEMCLCHFDYERDKPGYPEAHLQVHGESAALAAMAGGPEARMLHRLHFPAGGRRFRLTLEDVIEFLVAAGLASGRQGWADVVAAEREEFYRIQLRAAVRRDPQTARDVLSTLDQET
jgi:hypothetical protein